jgi:hypothetical protein
MANEQAMKEEAEFAEAFGVEPEPETEDDVVPVEVAEEEPAPEEPAAEEPEPSPDVAAEVEDEPMDEKELQRKRSWEGRLRAKEAELKAKEEALKASHPAETQDSPETPEEEAVEEAVEKLEDGFDVDTVMKEMADDFGEDFAKKLTKLIEHKAAQIVGKTVEEKVGSVSKKVDTMLSNIKDTRVREHFEAIAEVHPDFLDIAENGSLKAYIDSLPEAEQAKASKIAEGGSTRQVIKLLNSVKESQKPKEDPVDTDAAEGVRSRGLKIPEKPSASSYEDAWDQF